MQCYLVGGAVRDKLLGYPFHERDWVVVGSTPEEMLSAGFKPVGRDFPVFLHPKTNEEYALARIERKSGRGYHGFTFQSSPDVTLEQDLSRRDLTINAIAQDNDGNLVDPYGGQRDITERLLRHVAPAFAEDPLRVLRVARFAARYHHLEFRIAPETLALMRNIVDAGEMEFLVAERVWKETERALGERDPHIYFQALQDCGALLRLCPELDKNSQSLMDLARCAQQMDSLAIRFAVLCATLDKKTLLNFCERIKAPNDFRELALLCIEQAATISVCSDPITAMNVLQKTDALRRPERFELLLKSCAALLIPTRQILRLQAALVAAVAVTAEPLVQRGFSGKALGEQLQHERLTAIQIHWNG
ncbi:MAG: cca [Verrucomicrobiaceae bacterium]|nr:cca [Verrucomicrobiaceae bacterium]